MAPHVAAAQEANADFSERFRNPPVESRPNLNRHGYSSDLAEDTKFFEEKLAEGYGGFAVNMNWNPRYLLDEAEFKRFYAVCDAAKNMGMNLWLYDENWYPSGMAGGLILKENPDWESEGLKFKSLEAAGGTTVSATAPPGKLLLARAVPRVNGEPQLADAVDVSGHVKEGTLNWQAPEGDWTVAMVTRDTLTEGYQAGGIKGGLPKHYPSLLMPEVTQRFIELTHDAYAQHSPRPIGEYFFSTFTDEPSAMAFGHEDLDHGTYPWKENLSREIESRYGWRVEESLLPLMLDEGPEGKRMRVEYFRTVADLMSQDFFGAIEDWCAEHGFLSGGHLLREESMQAQAFLYGSIFDCFREMGVPGIDILTNDPKITLSYLISARLAASAAELNGRSHVMLEFCPVLGEPTKPQGLGIYLGSMVGGVTHFNSYYKMEKLTPEERKEVNLALARTTLLMDQGLRVADIAVYYPIESLWAELRPEPIPGSTWWSSEPITPGVGAVESAFNETSMALFNLHREFSYVDSTAIEEAEVRDGKFVWKNGASRSVLILPQATTIPVKAWEKIRAFWQSGGVVIAVGSAPQNSPSEFPPATIQAQAAGIFTGGPNAKGGVGVLLPAPDAAALNAALDPHVERPFTVEPAGAPVLTSHKKTDEGEVVLLLNNSPDPQSLRFVWKDGKTVLEANPHTGDMREHKPEDPIQLEGYQSRLFQIR